MRNIVTTCGLVAVLAWVPGCSDSSSSGSSGSVSAMTLPSQLDLVEVQGTSGSPVLGAASAQGTAGVVLNGVVASESEHVVNTHFFDPTMEPIKMINEILCYISKIPYASNLDGQVHTAQVDVGDCEQGREENTSTSSTESGQGQSQENEQEVWQFRASRASNSAPQVMEMWARWAEEREGQVEETLIGVMIVQTAEVSTTNPFGLFDMWWCEGEITGATDPNLEDMMTNVNHANLRMRGYLRAVAVNGTPQLQIYTAEGDADYLPPTNNSVPSGEEAFRMLASWVPSGPASNPDQSGDYVASMEVAGNHGGQEFRDNHYFVATYDENHLATATRSAVTVTDVNQLQSVKVFDLQNRNRTVYRYVLYNTSDSTPVELTAGYSVFAPSGNANIRGWISNHGAWWDNPNFDPPNGQAITRVEYGGGGQGETLTTGYNLVKSAGRLLKRTKVTPEPTLADLAGTSFFTRYPPDSPSGQDIQASITTTAGLAKIMWVATRPQGNEVWPWPATTPADITSSFLGKSLFMYVPGSGDAHVDVPGSLSAVTATTSVQLWVESSGVTLADNTVLHAYRDMVKSNLTATQLNAGWSVQQGDSNSVFYANASGVSSGNRTYTWDKDTFLLQDTTGGGGNVVFHSSVTEQAIEQSDMRHGVRSGPLYTTPLTSLGAEPTTHYVWETGLNNWNQFNGLTDPQGALVLFDNEIHILYTGNVLDRSGTAVQTTLSLNYANYGELHGFPWTEDGFNYWTPLYTLPDGTLLSGGTYKARWLDVEESARVLQGQTPSGVGLSLGTAAGLSLPAEAFLLDSARPAFSQPPALP